MTTRRRRIAGLIIAFLVGALAVGWFGSRGGNPDVKLLFLQYTDKLGKRGYEGLQNAATPSALSDDVFWTYSDWLTNPPSAR